MAFSKVFDHCNRTGRYQGLVRKLSLAILISLSGLGAAAAEQGEGLAGSTTVLSSESIFQLLVGLVIVVVIILALSLTLKKFSIFSSSSSGIIKIVGGLALNSKDRLLLVQIGEEQILISASPGRVGKVHDMRTPINPESINTVQQAGDGKFSSVLDFVTQRSRS